MLRRYLVVAAALLSSAVAGAQIGGSDAWLYPRDVRRDPMQPPAELYESAGRASLRVEVVISSPRRSRALVRLGDGGPYSVVGAGDRVGDYRIARVGPEGVVAVLSALGAERSVIIPADTTRVVSPR
jgi:hypothetical protein